MVKYHKNGIIAQLVEHMPYKHGVIGSSPIGSTKKKPRLHGAFFLKLPIFPYFLYHNRFLSTKSENELPPNYPQFIFFAT